MDASNSLSTRRHPAGLLPSLREIDLVCPLCRQALEVLAEAYRCTPCQRTYTLHAGIPDFRVFPDPYLNIEADRARTEIVLQGLEQQPNLEALLEYYWSFSDVTPIPLRSKFVRSAMLGEGKARRVLRLLEGDTFAAPVTPQTARRVLEIGSGTGGFLAVAAPHYEQVIGIDIAMRWLHVSRRRFMDRGLPVPPLVCCCAEHLPFPDGTFDLAVAAATLEFVRDQRQVLTECARVLTDNGAFFLQTVNRFAVSGDPYAYLWGVGYVPRAGQARYVRWRRQASYEHIHLLSFGELQRMAAEQFRSREFTLPDVDTEVLDRFPPLTRLLVHLYRAVKRFPPVGLALKGIGPGWDVKLRKMTAG